MRSWHARRIHFENQDVEMLKLGRVRAPALLLAFAPMAFAGCASMSGVQKGAIIGAGGGAAAGAVIGKATGSTARGAIIGAAVGGAAGALIGRQMDKQAQELAVSIPGATVQRVGEGIVVTFDSGILFGFDSDQLSPAARENLRNLAESLQKHGGTEVLLVGHTDSVGSDSYNQGLSERRAGAAANYLTSLGLGSSRIRSAGRGKTEPIASNETDAGRQENRRVEVAIFADASTRQSAQRQAGTE
jgi:outer membrane protein OmpA-like peptidoglycan-associated protein